MSAAIVEQAKGEVESLTLVAARALLDANELERTFGLVEEYIGLLETQVDHLVREVHDLSEELRVQEQAFANTIDFDEVV